MEWKQIVALYSLHYQLKYRNEYLEIPFHATNKKCFISFSFSEGGLMEDASTVFVNKVMQQKMWTNEEQKISI